MPSNKTLTILIVCFGVVTSIYLFERNPNNVGQNNLAPTENIDVVNINSIENKTSNDWKKILVNVGQNQNTTVLTSDDSSAFDGTTLTAQMARDFFSQYLLVKKGGGALTSNDVDRITGNILSSPEYIKETGPVYIAANLHINPDNSLDTIKKYQDILNLSLKTRSMQIKDSPVTALNNAVKSGGQDALLRLDSTISIGKGMISDLLNMDVPSSAVGVHLGLLNASSNVLSNLEAMRVAFTDPVRGLAGISRYNKQMLEFQTALVNINKYFEKKLGTSY